MINKKHYWILSLIVLTIVFASMGIFARYLKDDFTIFQQTYLRIGLAALFSLLFFWRAIDFKKIITLPKKEWWLLLLRSFSCYAFAVPFFTIWVIYAKYSNVSFISAFPWLAILGWFVVKEKFYWSEFFFVILAFLGSIIVGMKDFGDLSSIGYGELMAFIGSIGFALSYIARKRQSDALNNKEISFLMLALGSSMVFIISLVIWEWLPSLAWFGKDIVLQSLILTAGLNVANVFLTNYGFKNSPAILADIILSLEGIIALWIGYFLYAEIATFREWFGSLLILIAVIGVSTIKKE